MRSGPGVDRTPSEAPAGAPQAAGAPPDAAPAYEVSRVNRNSTPRLVAEELVRFVRENRLRRGDVLPPTARLARMLGVSLATLREGLRELEAYGMVSVRQGRGVFVEADPGELIVRPNPYVALYPLKPAEVLDLMDARGLIEVETARLAAERARPEHLEQMRGLLDRMRAERDRADEFIQDDVAFHMVIAESSHNVVYPRLLTAVRETFLAQQQMAVALPGAAERACRYHEAVHEAISRRDGQGAARSMAEHLADIKRNLSRALGVDEGAREDVR